MERLPVPRPRFRKVGAISLVAFTVFSSTAAILMAGYHEPTWSEVGVVLASVAGASVVTGLVIHLCELGTLAWRRASAYDSAFAVATEARDRLTRAAELLRLLNTDLDIQGIRDERGTVHLEFPYGTNEGLGPGAVVEIVRQIGGERLGTVQVVQEFGGSCIARPIDRTASEFWEALEDRMRSDFSPPRWSCGPYFPNHRGLGCGASMSPRRWGRRGGWLMPDRLEGLVADILNEREVVINIGTKNGVEPGMKFAILSPRPHEIFDPKTKEKLGVVERVKVRLKASDVREKFAVLRTYETYTVNMGGRGPDFLGTTAAVSSLFMPPRWVTKVKTLRVDQSDLPGELSESESIVKVNDRVVQIFADEESPILSSP
jgi:hypothetical protein